MTPEIKQLLENYKKLLQWNFRNFLDEHPQYKEKLNNPTLQNWMKEIDQINKTIDPKIIPIDPQYKKSQLEKLNPIIKTTYQNQAKAVSRFWYDTETKEQFDKTIDELKKQYKVKNH